ncbi:MAG: family 1 glycosylhydrolase [Clostridia bacterium]|nr:family 1 glycosylhydrolase [Clostridia bacterium]
MNGYTLRKDLKLGVATAATQIEGEDKNNTWYRWPKDGTKTKDGSSSIQGNMHWKNYRAHIDLMSEMGLEIYRMSLEWSRIEPEEGHFCNEAMSHYIDEINYLKEKGIDVLVTLHHFSNPLWFDDLGGFDSPDSVRCFTEYAEYVAENLKGLVTSFCTINEPNVYATSCFLLGEWINEEKDFMKLLRIYRNMAKCHTETYSLIHRIIPEAEVGIALNINHFFPLRKNSLFDRIGCFFYDRGFHTALTYAMGYGKLIFPLGFTKKKGEFFDFFGMNYYTSNAVKGAQRITLPEWPANNLGWGITPWGFKEELERFHKMFPDKPVYITENGTCDRDDHFRARYIYDHLKVITELPYVKRYYHWTFMDNFEWAQGTTARFGLVKYNYEDDTYEVRKSGHFYSEIIEKRCIDQEMIEKYDIGEYHD